MLNSLSFLPKNSREYVISSRGKRDAFFRFLFILFSYITTTTTTNATAAAAAAIAAAVNELHMLYITIHSKLFFNVCAIIVSLLI